MQSDYLGAVKHKEIKTQESMSGLTERLENVEVENEKLKLNYSWPREMIIRIVFLTSSFLQLLPFLVKTENMLK